MHVHTHTHTHTHHTQTSTLTCMHTHTHTPHTDKHTNMHAYTHTHTQNKVNDERLRYLHLPTGSLAMLNHIYIVNLMLTEMSEWLCTVNSDNVV